MSDETTRPPGRSGAVAAVQDAMVLAGAGLVSFGAWLAWRPAGFIVAGMFLLVPGAIGALRSRAASKDGDS